MQSPSSLSPISRLHTHDSVMLALDARCVMSVVFDGLVEMTTYSCEREGLLGQLPMSEPSITAATVHLSFSPSRAETRSNEA